MKIKNTNKTINTQYKKNKQKTIYRKKLHFTPPRSFSRSSPQIPFVWFLSVRSSPCWFLFQRIMVKSLCGALRRQGKTKVPSSVCVLVINGMTAKTFGKTKDLKNKQYLHSCLYDVLHKQQVCSCARVTVRNETALRVHNKAKNTLSYIHRTVHAHAHSERRVPLLFFWDKQTKPPKWLQPLKFKLTWRDKNHSVDS